MNCPNYDLERLPKGSRCIEPKNVPARSGYWRDDTDSVERCAVYDTGDGDSDSDRSPEGDPPPGGGGGGGGGGGPLDTPPESVGKFERTEWEDDERKPATMYRAEGGWVAGFPATLDQHKPLVITLRVVTSTRSNIVVVDARFWEGEKTGTPDEQTRVAKRQSPTPEKRPQTFNKALKIGIEWMEDNQPTEAPEYDPADELPGDVNGWEEVDYDSLPVAEHNEHGYAWERWTPPIPQDPERRKERLTIHKNKGKWHVRQWYLDSDGEKVGGTGPTRFPELPDKGRSLSPRSGGGKRTAFSELERAADPVRERMENRPSEQTEWPDLPRFDIQTEVGDLKNVGQLIKRIAPRDAQTYKHGVLEVDAVDLNLRGVDDDNTTMYDVDLLKDGFETTKFNRDAGWHDGRGKEGAAAVDSYALASAIADHNKSENIEIRTFDAYERNPNDPVEIHVDSEKVAVLWPEEYARDVDLPDLEWDTSLKVLSAKELDDALKEHGPSVLFELTVGRRFYVRHSENEGEFTQIDASADFADDEPVQSAYTSDKLRLTTMSVPRPKSTGIELRYSDQFPVRFDLRIGPNEVTTFTAPRIMDEIPDSLSQPHSGGPCSTEPDLREPVSASDGPLAQPDELPPKTFKSLRDAWTGYKIALSRGDRGDARQFACIINGIRAGRSMAPLEFTELAGFKCAPSQE